jgi:hypothetical protein
MSADGPQTGEDQSAQKFEGSLGRAFYSMTYELALARPGINHPDRDGALSALPAEFNH